MTNFRFSSAAPIHPGTPAIPLGHKPTVAGTPTILLSTMQAGKDLDIWAQRIPRNIYPQVMDQP